MRICIVGTGYVGLVSAACFAEMGNDVRCVDVNPEVVALLDSGRIHIFEPGLEDLVSRNRQEGRLRFTTSLADGLDDAEFAFITVGTPSLPVERPLPSMWCRTPSSSRKATRFRIS